MDWWWWVFISIAWLATGYFVMRYPFIRTIAHMYRNERERPEQPMSTARKGGFAIELFVLVLMWPIWVVFCTVYWFFWGLSWVIGKIIERLEQR